MKILFYDGGSGIRSKLVDVLSKINLGWFKIVTTKEDLLWNLEMVLPEVLILDKNIEQDEAFNLIVRISGSYYPHIKVLVLQDLISNTALRLFIEAGALGIVTANDIDTQLKPAILTIAKRKYYIGFTP